MGLNAKPGDWAELLDDSLEDRRERDGPIPIPPLPDPKKRKSRSKDAREEERELGLREELQKIDPDFLVKRMIRVIQKEIQKIEEKQDRQEDLTAAEAKLLDSYIRSVLAAEEKLSIGKRALSSKNIEGMTEAELKELLK